MNRAIKGLFALLIFLILTVSGILAAEKINKPEIKILDDYIAVFDFEVTTGDLGISRPLTESVRRELVMSGKYEVIDRGNMNKILGEQKFQLSGCVAQECIVDAGQLLGVGKIISGTVSIVGKTYYLTLSLISVKTGKIENVAEDTCRCEIDELLGSTKRLAKKLIGEQVEQPVAKAPKPAIVAESKDDAIAKTEATAKVKAEEIEKVKAEQIAKAKAEAEETARAKAKADAIAKAAEIERAKATQIAKAKAEAEEVARVKAKADETAKAEAKQHGLKAAPAAIDPAVVSVKIVASDGRYEKLASGVVRDKQSGLDWYAGPDKNTSQTEAVVWANSLRVDGGGWRTPTITELKGLYQKGAGPRNMTPMLEITDWVVWSVETGIEEGRAGEPTGWALGFEDGRELVDRRDNSFSKRGFAVRFTTESATAVIDKTAAGTKIISSDGRYEKLASGVVRDKQSGLDWYAGPDKNTSQTEAVVWANSLRVDGGGWRLPSLDELKGLFQKGAGSHNMTPMLGTTGWVVWSVETGIEEGRAGEPTGRALGFGDGRELVDRRDDSFSKRGFAVRSTTESATAAIDKTAAGTKIISSDGRFEKLANGIIRDNQSGLEWYAGPDKNTGWDDVKTLVAKLNVDGGGWRMPTIAELKSLYRKGAGSRNMTPLLEITGLLIWSGETGVKMGRADESSVWTLDFSDGREIMDKRDSSNGKRGFAVRSRK